MNEEMTATAKDTYKAILDDFKSISTPIFTQSSPKHGVKHFIVTSGPPVHARARRLPPDKLAAAKARFAEIQEVGIIRRSNSPCSSPLHVVPKSDGGWRPCGDYRRLNEITTPDRYPIPNLQDFTSGLAGKTVSSKFDLVCSYHQIPMKEEDIPQTSIITPFGLHEFLHMLFGLKNAAQTFQRLMDTVCHNLDFVFVYLDDIMAASKDEAEH